MIDGVTSRPFSAVTLPPPEDQIPEIQGEIDFLKIQYLSSDQILFEAKDLYTKWPQLQNEEKRKVIENITDRITIGSDDINIELCYLPSSLRSLQKTPLPHRFIAPANTNFAGKFNVMAEWGIVTEPGNYNCSNTIYK